MKLVAKDGICTVYTDFDKIREAMSLPNEQYNNVLKVMNNLHNKHEVVVFELSDGKTNPDR